MYCHTPELGYKEHLAKQCSDFSLTTECQIGADAKKKAIPAVQQRSFTAR